MQLPINNNKFDRKKVEGILRNENKFITEVFSFTLIPERHEQNDSDEDNGNSHIKTYIPNGKKTTRAKSLEELQQRLHAITSKKKLTYKEKLLKKGIKNRMKKKNLNDERKAKKKLERAAKVENDVKHESKMEVKVEINEVNSAHQTVFNKEDKMVFSKFNFSNLGKNKKVKKEKDPKKILQKIEQDQEKLEKLKESGDIEKVIEIKEKTAWKNALAKASGEKVKDDPILLKKSLKKQEQKHKTSKKKWEQRLKGVENAKEERQKKRQENISKRKKDKKTKKLKRAAKRGKIIPGL